MELTPVLGNAFCEFCFAGDDTGDLPFNFRRPLVVATVGRRRSALGELMSALGDTVEFCVAGDSPNGFFFPAERLAFIRPGLPGNSYILSETRSTIRPSTPRL
jgi:hypothetical protein